VTAHESPRSGREAFETIRVPLVLGVTGHRDLHAGDETALRTTVAHIFLDLQKNRFPHSPLRLLTSLAPGADQLVAEVAEKHGVEILVPLPFPADIYAASSSFEGFPAAREKLHEWLFVKKVKSFVVPLPEKLGSTDLPAWEHVIRDPQRRRIAYANTGGYIARHCHALIGLWNGKLSGNPSGTEEIIDYKLRGQRPKLFPWHEPLGVGDELGPVYVVHTPRTHSGDSDDSRPAGQLQIKVGGESGILTAEELRWKPSMAARLKDYLYPLPSHKQHQENPETEIDDANQLRFARWRQFLETGQAIDEFNRDAAAHRKHLLPRLTARRDSALWTLTDRRLPKVLHKLILLRETAAALAAQLDGQFSRCQLTLFITLFIGVSSFDLYGHPSLFAAESASGTHQPVLLWILVVAIALCLLIAVGVWYSRLSERRLDYRALAETLRVRIYWAVAGIGLSVADSYLGQLRGEISWARMAMKTSSPPPALWQECFQSQTPEAQLEQLRLVEKDWVIGQAQFFQTSFTKRHHAGGWYRARGLTLAGLSALAAAGTAIFGYAGNPSILLLTAVDIVVLLAALLLVYSERQSHEDLAKQYERMTAMFKQGAAELKTYLHSEGPPNLSAAQATILALGQEAINEHSQWLILRRNRPFEVPVP
jgi:hypothetical protein